MINLKYDWLMMLSLGGSVVSFYQVTSYGPRREKPCLPWFANNKGPDQPAHPHSLISAFVIRLLESIIYRLATSETSTF